MSRARPLAAYAASAALLGCHPGTATHDVPEASASPQASAVPAPVTMTNAVAGTAGTLERGVSPVPLRGDAPLPADAPPRDTGGYTLSAVLKPADLPSPPRVPELNAAGLDLARRRTELRLDIDLSSSRMRVGLVGRGFVLPENTEIRARGDRYGHIVVWPGGGLYAALGPGTLRALVGERRFDAAPLAPAEVVTKDEPGKRIGIRTRRAEVSTRAARAMIEVGRLPELGDGGVLLCRFLLDLMSAPPQTPLCGADEIPLRADVRWTSHGALGFELTGVLKKSEMPALALLVPPPNAESQMAPLPTGGVAPMLALSELAAFRTAPVDVATAPSAGDGLALTNASDQLRVLYLDGVAVAWSAPSSRGVLTGLPRGRYTAQWRTFLGDAVDPPTAVTVPGLAQTGAPEASR